ncbi:MAG TPA: response regulator transcription factor [Vicinamibacterales bacterium]|nr:response regulator transcription factor [Vicinamibacterales bacterium]
MPAPRVLLADDHTLLLDAFERLLVPECQIVGKVGDGRALLAAARDLKPDIVVLDVAMPLLNGIDAGRQIKQMLPDTRLVFLTMNEEPEIAAEAFRVGASAFLLKRSAASELVTAIREAMNGRSYVTPIVTSALVRACLHPRVEERRRDELTPREREVLQLLAEGRSMKEAAAILNVTARTVAFHKYAMMARLGVTTTADLIKFAITHHLA